MNRCQEQIQILNNCKNREFSFCIMDEIFVSTNYYEGVSGAYAIVNKVAKYPNAINIVTTHFPSLSKACLENKKYKNYYFPIEFNELGDMLRTYKITEGESKQHMAIKMLETKGFDKDIIKDARKMYEKLINETTQKATKIEEITKQEEIKKEEIKKEEIKKEETKMEETKMEEIKKGEKKIEEKKIEEIKQEETKDIITKKEF